MCLSRVFTDEEMEQAIEELPEVAPGIVRLFKAVCVVDEKYHALNFQEFFKEGINYAKQPFIKADCNTKYYAGFHFWGKMEDSNNIDMLVPFVKYCHLTLVMIEINHGIFASQTGVISCLAKKEWFDTAGRTKRNKTALVTSQAFFPTYPETEAKMDDFLKWLEKNDPEYTKKYLKTGGSSGRRIKDTKSAACK